MVVLKSSLNTISDAVLLEMVKWVCNELGYPFRRLQKASFRKRRRGWCGRCYGKFVFSVRLCEVSEKWPVEHTRFGYLRTMRDPWDALVCVTAHELAHCLDHLEEGKTNERSAEWQEDKVWKVWDQRRSELLEAWGHIQSAAGV